MLFRGNAEADIRRNLVRKGYIKGIIGLPPTCSTARHPRLHHRRRQGGRPHAPGHLHDRRQQRLHEGRPQEPPARPGHPQDRRCLHPAARRPQILAPGELCGDRKNEFNLNLPRYIDSQEPEDIQDIAGHLCGGIPNCDIAALEKYWCVLPGLKSALFHPLRDDYSQLSILHSQLKQTIYAHPEFVAFIERMNAHFAAAAEKRRHAQGPASWLSPKEVIAALAEDLLAHYAGKPLIDKYDVYQHLMDYWAETMQDDCYLIAADGWKAETYRIMRRTRRARRRTRAGPATSSPRPSSSPATSPKSRKPSPNWRPSWKASHARLSELEEEHGGEEGVFSALDKVNKANVTARLKEIRGLFARMTKRPGGSRCARRVAGTEQPGGRSQEEAEGRRGRAGRQAYAQYPGLTEDDVKTLVVDDKWLAALEAAIHGEMERISQALTSA